VSTAPYSEDTPDLLTRSLSHVSAARVVLPTGETIALADIAGNLSFDEKRAPRVSVTLTASVPTDPAVLERIDPRTGARLEIDLGYRRPGGLEDVHTIADLVLRSRPVSRPDDTMTLEGLSDESLIIDCAHAANFTVNTASTTAGMTYILGTILTSPTVTITSPTGPAINQTEADADRWNTLADLADRIEARVYDDGLRNWWITPVPVLGTPALALAVGQGGTLTATDADMSRDDDWANRVYLLYSWTDSSDVLHTIRAMRQITSGPYSTANTVRTLKLERNIPATQTQANAAAAALVARTVTRGRSLTVTGVSAYWLRPGDTVDVTLLTGPTERHLVVSVAFDLKTGLMDVTTRLPDNTGTIGA
jgi:hypothetical protein